MSQTQNSLFGIKLTIKLSQYYETPSRWSHEKKTYVGDIFSTNLEEKMKFSLYEVFEIFKITHDSEW